MQQVAREHGTLRVIAQFARVEDIPPAVPEEFKNSGPILLFAEQTGLGAQTN
jgi:hypothetical protein